MRLLSLFKRKPEIEQVSVHLGDLEDWFMERMEPRLREVRKEIRTELTGVQETRKQLLNLAQQSSKKMLMNPNISFEAMREVEQYRTTYTKGLTTFMRHIEIPEVKATPLRSFCDDFDEELEEFSANTAEAVHTVKQHFPEILEKPVEQLERLRTHVGQIRETLEDENHGLVFFEQTVAEIRELQQRAQEFQELEEQKEELSTRIERLEQQREHQQQLLDELKQSSAYEAYQKLEDRKEALKEERMELKRELRGILDDKPSNFHEAVKKLDDKEEAQELYDTLTGVEHDLKHLTKSVRLHSAYNEAREKERRMRQLKEHIERLGEQRQEIQDQIASIRFSERLQNLQETMSTVTNTECTINA